MLTFKIIYLSLIGINIIFQYLAATGTYLGNLLMFETYDIIFCLLFLFKVFCEEKKQTASTIQFPI